MLDVNSGLYQKFWTVTAPLFWLFYILVVFELCGLILEKHKGLYTLGRWAMYLAMAVSVTVSVLSLLPRITPAMPQRTRIMGYVYATERGVDFSLAIFISADSILFKPLPRAVEPECRGPLRWCSRCSSSAIRFGLLLHSVFGLQLKNEVNIFLMGTSSACVVAWLVLLNAKGEKVRVSTLQFGRGDEERILLQLDSLNDTLLKASHK